MTIPGRPWHWVRTDVHTFLKIRVDNFVWLKFLFIWAGLWTMVQFWKVGGFISYNGTEIVPTLSKLYPRVTYLWDSSFGFIRFCCIFICAFMIFKTFNLNGHSAYESVKWGASSRWSSSLYYPVRNLDKMTIGKMQPHYFHMPHMICVQNLDSKWEQNLEVRGCWKIFLRSSTTWSTVMPFNVA